MSIPLFTNIGLLADELAKRGKSELRAKVTQAWRAQSCLGDLRQAMDCVGALRGLIKRPKSEDTAEKLITEKALMTTAVMLYARATSTNTSSGERGSIQLAQSKLTPEEWVDHCAIVEVRNEAMAHVHSSRILGDHTWHRDIFFAVDVGERGWRPASASNQTSYHAATLDRVERMLPVAHREIKAKFEKRMNAVTDMINKEVKKDALQRHRFDPLPMFGGPEGVRRILADIGKGVGETVMWVNEGDRRSAE